MLALTLLLLLQAQPTLRTGTASDYAVPQAFRLSGKIVVGLDEPVIAAITLRPVVGDVPPQQTVQSFANGTFRFDNVILGTYVVGVVDCLLYTSPSPRDS